MIRAAALVAVAIFGAAEGADAACRQALALGLDVSGSVDATEYRIQAQGLAGALSDPRVQGALFAMPDAPVSLAVFEWSGPGAQRLVQDWVVLQSPDVLNDVSRRLATVQRHAMDVSTALGEAKAFGHGLLAQQAHCWRRVLDLSGDGPSNTGPRPQDMPAMPGVMINGLVIGDPPRRRDAPKGPLEAYYDAYVIEGPGAFVEAASGFDTFQEAMVRKLLRELQVLTLASR